MNIVGMHSVKLSKRNQYYNLQFICDALKPWFQFISTVTDLGVFVSTWVAFDSKSSNNSMILKYPDDNVQN